MPMMPTRSAYDRGPPKEASSANSTSARESSQGEPYEVDTNGANHNAMNSTDGSRDIGVDGKKIEAEKVGGNGRGGNSMAMVEVLTGNNLIVGGVEEGGDDIVDGREVLSGVREGLVEQRARRLDMRGEKLSLMCVGEAGLGKRSLMSALFGIGDGERGGSVNGVSVKVKIVDVGDGGIVTGLVEGLEDGFERALERESRIERLDYEGLDEELGVDVCLYFVSPHHMRGTDVELMKGLCKRVALIPILAKADAMTSEELDQFRQDVFCRLSDANVKLFREPFAVITSKMERSPTGKLGFSKGRKYPWGTALSETLDHSELPALRRCLLHEDLLELHECRRSNFETYRAEKLDRFQAARRGFGAFFNSMRNQIVKTAIHTIIGLGVLILINEYAERHMISIRGGVSHHGGWISPGRRKDEERNSHRRRAVDHDHDEGGGGGLLSIFSKTKRPPPGEQMKPKNRALIPRMIRGIVGGIISLFRDHRVEEREPERRGFLHFLGSADDGGKGKESLGSSDDSKARSDDSSSGTLSLFGRR